MDRETATGKAGTLRKGRVPEPIVGRVFIGSMRNRMLRRVP